MGVFWVVMLGVALGWLASQILDSGVYRLAGDIVAGILGAYAGTWLAFRLLGIGVTEPSLAGAAAALVGALSTIVAFHMLGPGRQTLGQILLGR